ncbi:histidine--tRNA ligase [Candidatus Woesearchaeota archaeon]|nr:histidine--tRNA ligase [Candidatus Woesearchaeota archaeon]
MKLELAKGVKDIYPEEKILQQRVMDVFRRTFELYGYAPIETPLLEKYEVLASKYAGGSEILNEMFTLNDQGGRRLALRYDLTVPFCRFVGMNKTLKMPFKRYEMGPVFRDGPISVSRFRQFWQCDVDVVGIKSMKIDAEFVEIFNKVFEELGLNVEVRVNNRKILDAIMERLEINKPGEVILIVDKLDKIGVKGVSKELKEIGTEENQIRLLLKIISVEGTNKQKLKSLRDQLGVCEGLDEIEEVMKYSDKFVFDISLARGLAYYTGTIYEVYLKNGEIKTAVASGGRYDKMISGFLESNQDYPALGISFGLSRIALALQNQNIKSVNKVYVIPIKTEVNDVVKNLRNSGINTDVDYNSRGVSKNLDYASKLGIPYCLIIGEKELKSNKYTLRNMNTGKELKLSITEIIKKLK